MKEWIHSSKSSRGETPHWLKSVCAWKFIIVLSSLPVQVDNYLRWSKTKLPNYRNDCFTFSFPNQLIRVDPSFTLFQDQIENMNKHRLIASVFKCTQKCNRLFIVLKHFSELLRNHVSTLEEREKMLSELIQPWESSDLDKWPLCPLSSIIAFVLQIGYLCGGDCVNMEDTNHLEVQLIFCFLGPSGNTQSFLGIWVGSRDQRTSTAPSLQVPC